MIYRYSNIGYWLLGNVVAAASGQAFTDYVDEAVLAPLGIEPERLGYEVRNAHRHASGYLEKYSIMNLFSRFLVDKALLGPHEGRWRRINNHYVNGPAFGGLVGTARSFGGFLQDQLAPHSRLLDDTTRDLFYEPQRTRRGTIVPMTLGWHVGTVEGIPYFFKEGGGAGFHCMMRVYRACAVASVVMTNATQFDVNRCMDRVDREFVSSAQPR